MCKLRVLFLSILFLVLGACTEKSTTSTDDAATGDTDVAGDELLSDADTYDFWKDGPQRPHPVDWGTCPEGWEPKEEKDEDGNLLAKYCEPILPPDDTECEPGYFAMFGSTECQRIGDPCPEGEFADIPTDAGTEIIYVSEGESIQAAIDAAQDGAVIAIGKGTFTEKESYPGDWSDGNPRDAAISISSYPSKSITLWGACPEKTILRSDTPPLEGLFSAIIMIKQYDPSSRVLVRDITVSGNRIGIAVKASSSNEDNFLVRRTSLVELENVAIVDAKETGLYIRGSARVFFTNGLIRNTVPDDWGLGMGIDIDESASLVASRLIVEKSRSTGIKMDSSDEVFGSLLIARDLIVRDTLSRESDQGNTNGEGIIIGNHVTADLSRVLIEQNRNFGIIAVNASGVKQKITAKDIIIRDTLPEESSSISGFGLAIADSDELYDTGATEVKINNALIEKSHSVGLYAGSLEGGETWLMATDLIVRDTYPNMADSGVGSGMELSDNSTIVLERTLIERNKTFGMAAYTEKENSYVDLFVIDLRVLDTESQQSDYRWGDGLVLMDNVTAEINRTILKNNREIGMLINNSSLFGSPLVTLRNVLISNTNIRKCYELKLDCGYAPDMPFGHGLGIYDGAEAFLSNVVVDGNQHGLQIKNAKVFTGENCSLPFGDEEGKTICVHILDNETAINAFDLPADYDVFAAFANTSTWYEGNGTPFSGDPEDVPEPPDPTNNPMEE
ncbi:MAG TPA: right-handed parallel beta-helix repeat-containing protein [bacterium]|nr:right-handed parallel beta-helix repeat-containing protein [bacterium]